jgi:hypothetical protein
MGEHAQLQAVIRHVLRHVAERGDHVRTKLFTPALYCKRTAAIPVPLVERRRRVLPEPCDEKFRYFVVMDRISVRGVVDPYI